jgi:hypothetical protein
MLVHEPQICSGEPRKMRASLKLHNCKVFVRARRFPHDFSHRFKDYERIVQFALEFDVFNEVLAMLLCSFGIARSPSPISTCISTPHLPASLPPSLPLLSLFIPISIASSLFSRHMPPCSVPLKIFMIEISSRTRRSDRSSFCNRVWVRAEDCARMDKNGPILWRIVCKECRWSFFNYVYLCDCAAKAAALVSKQFFVHILKIYRTSLGICFAFFYKMMMCNLSDIYTLHLYELLYES